MIHKSSAKRLSAISIIILTAALMPFLILSFFTVPSTDDYDFVYRAREYGTFGAQMQLYLSWTGRYSSMFLLSLHPMVTDFLLGYRVLALLHFLFSFHALYYFFRKTLEFPQKWSTVLICLALIFLYILFMPQLVQGFYWLPGSITYQLANILVLYFLGNTTNIRKGIVTTGSWFVKVINSLLIITICGLNETSMVVLCYIIGSIWLLDVIRTTRLNLWLTWYTILALICSSIVYLAPGNTARVSHDAVEKSTPDLLKVLISSIEAAVQLVRDWTSFSLLLFSVVFLFIATRSDHFQKRPEWSMLRVFLFTIWFLGLITISVLPIHYVYGDLTPLRTVNISYWLYLLGFVTLLLAVHQYGVRMYNSFVHKNYHRLLLPGVLLFLIVGASSSNRPYLAWNDLISGRASELAEQYTARHRIMQECSEDICLYPNYTVVPKTIFNDDFGRDVDSDFARRFAQYYGHDAASAVFAEPEFLKRFRIDVESKGPFFGNLETITDEVSRSGRYSSEVAPNSGYSITYTKALGDIDVKNVQLISTVEATVFSHCPDQNCVAQLVITIMDPNGESLFWYGALLLKNESEHWVKTTFRTRLPDKHLSEKNSLLLYVWNKGDAPVFVDDFELLVY